MSSSEHAPLKRDPAGDVLRAWAIVGVVAIHALDITVSGSAFKWVSGYFRWAVPAFIILSAYYTALATGSRPVDSLLPWMRQRYIKLLPPFLFFSGLYFLLSADFTHLTWQRVITRHFAGYGWAGQYFFIILFQLLPMMWLVSRIRVHGVLVLVSLSAGVLMYWWAPTGYEQHLVLRQLSDRPFWYWLPYVVYGVYLAQNQGNWFARILSWPAWVKAALIVSLPGLIAMAPAPIENNSPYTVPMVLLVSVAYVPLMLATFHCGGGHTLAYLGRHSMTVFCLNPLFVWICRVLVSAVGFKPTSNWLGIWCASTVLVLLVVIACLCAGFLIRRLGWGRVLPV